MLRSLTPVLGCGLMMVVCMAVMAGARKRRNEPAAPATTDEVAELRDEVARLGSALEDAMPVGSFRAAKLASHTLPCWDGR